jgi:hypothetical protein
MCPNLNCDYLYAEESAQITDAQNIDPNQVTVDAGSVILVRGASLPDIGELVSVKLGPANAQVQDGATTEEMRIEILDSTIAGNWHVTLTTERGDIKVLQSVVPFSIPLIVESVEP